MARILILCSRVPYPPVGGARLRMLNTARVLSDHHEVDLLVVTDEEENDDASQLRQEFSSVHIFRHLTYRFYVNTLRGLASRKPLQTFYYRVSDAANWLDQNANNYDLFFCNHVRTAEYVRSRKIPKVIDLVDAISRNYEQARQFSTGLWRLVYPIETRRLRRYEPQVVADFDHTLITTDADRRHIQRKRPVGPISVVPNGVNEKLLSIESRFDTDNDDVIFLGKMDYAPNIDAVKYFVNEMLPRIRQRTDCQFTIVGAPVDSRVASLANRPGVKVTGFVEDPSEYLSRARVVVAPIRFGAGIQNKILEAMALGRPVVTTPLGAEGIEAEDSKHLIISEDTDDYVSGVVNLLLDVTEARRLGKAARELVQERYRWDTVGEQIHLVIDDVLP